MLYATGRRVPLQVGAVALLVALVVPLLAPAIALGAFYWEYNPGTYAGSVSWSLLSDAEKQWYWANYETASVMRYEQQAAAVANGSSSVSTAYYGYKSGVVAESAVVEVAGARAAGTTITEVASATGKSASTVVSDIIRGVQIGRASGLRAWGERVLGGADLSGSLWAASLYMEAGQSMGRIMPHMVHADGSTCPYATPWLCTEGDHYLPDLFGPNDGELDGIEAEISTGTPFVPPTPPTGWSDVTGLYSGKPAPFLNARNSAGDPLDSVDKVNALLFDPECRLRLLVKKSGGWVYTTTEYESAWAYDWSSYTQYRLWDPDTGWMWGEDTPHLFRVLKAKNNGAVYTVYPSTVQWGSQIGTLNVYGGSTVTTESVTGPGIVLPPSTVAPVVRVSKVTTPEGGWPSDPTVQDVVDSVTTPLPSDLPDPVVEDVTETYPDTPVETPTFPDPQETGWVQDWFSGLIDPVLAFFSGLDIFWPFRFMAGKG